jgi:tRNAHis guanylyltransferase
MSTENTNQNTDLPALREDILPPILSKAVQQQMQMPLDDNKSQIVTTAKATTTSTTAKATTTSTTAPAAASQDDANQTQEKEPLSPAVMLKILKKVGVSDPVVPNHHQSLRISKKLWEECGNVITPHEKILQDIDKNTFWTIRLDGKGFSRLVKRLRKNKVIQRGYSVDFGNIMVETADAVMHEIHGCCAFIQSDEMTIIVPGCVNDKQTHQHGGRLQKLVSTSASLATYTFNKLILELVAKKNKENAGNTCDNDDANANDDSDHDPDSDFGSDSDSDTDSSIKLPNRPITFDARIGQWNSLAEAMTLIFWRSNDCSVNGVSDAIHHLKGHPTIKVSKDVRGNNTTEKLKFLNNHNILPLNPHQEFGTFLWTTREPKECVNRKTKKTSIKMCLTTRKCNMYLPGAYNADKLIIEQYGVKIVS